MLLNSSQLLLPFRASKLPWALSLMAQEEGENKAGLGLMCTVLQHMHSRPGKPHTLTLALEEQDLHAVQGERLSEVVCH